MYDDTAMIMMLATLTSTHPGSGTELSFVDLPIQREGHTGYPKIEAATLKGCIRSSLNQKEKAAEERINRLFGMPNGGEFASSVSLTDSRLLFFPVKSVYGVFGWITCPLAIQRFFRDYELATGRDYPCEFKQEEGLVSGDKLIIKKVSPDQVVLEDYAFNVKNSPEFTAFLEEIVKGIPESTLAKTRIVSHALIVSDDDFVNFVKYSTEISTRIRIDANTGTVAGQALFSEEYLPPECIFYNLVFFTQTHSPQEKDTGKAGNKEEVKSEFIELFPSGTVVQIGADSSLGKGLVQINYEGAKR